MPEPIYLVAPTTKTLTEVRQATFATLGVQERRDLEAWILSHPNVLGEPLLVVTTEFDRFDKSERRLDILALDKEGALVVVELKLELSRSFADQQAVRYAAFCSTMTAEQLVEAMAAYLRCTTDEARSRIRDFLEVDELPELGNQPRIILAAGTLDDEELTSTVLWLRTFGVDISCVELKPYELPGGELILVPRTIIPLPEARNYQVRVEQKQAITTQRSKQPSSLQHLWNLIADQFNSLALPLKVTSRTGGNFLPLKIGHSEMHYEWIPLKTKRMLRVALHFESPDREINERRLQEIAAHRQEIAMGVEYLFFAGDFGKLWKTAEFQLPWDDTTPDDRIAPEAVCAMKILVERTYPTVKTLMGSPNGEPK
ncbi:MAG TPA: hypothetical protein VGI40_23930 [Pirellulaceae bacterium]|jgi:hypothetical protein